MAKESKKLLDIVSEVKNVTSALAKFKNHQEQILPESAQKQIPVMIDSLDCIYDVGRVQVAKISPVKYLLQAYIKCRVVDGECKRKRDDSLHTTIGYLRGFFG